jgi:peptidoglycan hydrolase FlgJ
MNITPLPAVSTATASPAEASRADDIQKAAEGFEALFIATLLKGARAGLPGDDLTGGQAIDSATQMLDSHLATVAGNRAGFGIAKAVARQFAGPEAKP